MVTCSYSTRYCHILDASGQVHEVARAMNCTTAVGVLSGVRIVEFLFSDNCLLSVLGVFSIQELSKLCTASI